MVSLKVREQALLTRILMRHSLILAREILLWLQLCSGYLHDVVGWEGQGVEHHDRARDVRPCLGGPREACRVHICTGVVCLIIMRGVTC